MHCRRFKGNIKFSRASKLSTQYLEGVILISHLLNNLSRSFHNLYMHKRVLWGQLGDALKCTEGAGRRAHQATLHLLPDVLAIQESPRGDW